eukprot:TRINITY_DN92269_c0_g1_i1.p1 TRINITY_DN92269_c0_g1~~TRINITY_DN92269_c0_g1_i1.p1  ORF type:complete len:897 (+),score=131.76 TRINITY_DN92269_c0_g1_i1:53-2692(+)
MSETCLALGKLARIVIRWRKAVIACWIVICLPCLYFAPSFPSATTISLSAPDGTEAAGVVQQFQRYFPRSADSCDFVGLVQAPNVLSLKALSNFTHTLRKQLNNSRPDGLVSFIAYSTTEEMFEVLEPFRPGISQEVTGQFVSPDNTSTVFTWTISTNCADDDGLSRAWAEQHSVPIWTANIKEFFKPGELTYEGTYSLPQVIDLGVESAETDMLRVDMISIPLAAIVLLMVVGSGRLLLLPLVCMLVSVLVSFGIVRILAYFMKVQSITPPLMMSMLIAMSIDYALFCLTRLSEEVEKARAARNDTPAMRSLHTINGSTLHASTISSDSQPMDTEAQARAAPFMREMLAVPEDDTSEAELMNHCLEKTMETSGATILLSGITLLASFSFLSLFPVAIIASLGFGCAITLAFMLVVNLTLMPAVLSLAPKFFLKASRGEGRTNRVCTMCSRVWSLCGKEFWNRLASRVTTCPSSGIMLVIAFTATALVSSSALHLATTTQVAGEIPTDAALSITYDRIIAGFGIGEVHQYKALLIPKEPSKLAIFSPEFFNASGTFLQELEEDFAKTVPAARGTGYHFMGYNSDGRGNKQVVPFDQIKLLCFGAKQVEEIEDICRFFLQSFSNSADYKQNATTPPTATFAYIVPSYDPMCPDGRVILDNLRASCSRLADKHGLECSIGGYPTEILAMVRVIYDVFPYLITATLVTAFIFLAVSFKSLFIPLRSIVSCLLTLGFVYGLATLVYQDGIFNWLGFKALRNNIPICWMLPVIAFFVISGICLDYDIFLLVRISEYRGQGLDASEAIRQGVVSTGGIITSAGAIMAVAFGGLLFASTAELRCLGWLMVSATLFDTFVVRTIVNPAIMSVMGRLNWWPSGLSHKM